MLHQFQSHIFWLACSLLPCAEQPAHAVELHVQGNRLLYGGKEVHLQGVAIGDPLIARDKRTTQDYITLAQQWNANTVRLSIHPSTWRDFGRKAVLAKLKSEIAAAHAAGLFVIVSWHAIGVPDGFFQQAPSGLPPDAYDSNFALAEDFWRQMAHAFGDDGAVIFEIWNEPVFANAPRDTASHWEELTPYWKLLITLLRAHGSHNVVLATGSQWGYRLDGVLDHLLEDGQTAYSWHVYPDSDEQKGDGWRKTLAGLNNARPVVVSEWGFQPDGHGGHQGTAKSFGDAFRTLLEAEHLHYTAWCWHPFWTPNMLKADWSTPTEYGKFVNETLHHTPNAALVRP